jgi:hypothetical protein
MPERGSSSSGVYTGFTTFRSTPRLQAFSLDDRILVRDVLADVKDAAVVEEYPDFSKGPCVLALQKDGQGKTIHVAWGNPRKDSSLAVLVTA